MSILICVYLEVRYNLLENIRRSVSGIDQKYSVFLG